MSKLSVLEMLVEEAVAAEREAALQQHDAAARAAKAQAAAEAAARAAAAQEAAAFLVAKEAARSQLEQEVRAELEQGFDALLQADEARRRAEALERVKKALAIQVPEALEGYEKFKKAFEAQKAQVERAKALIARAKKYGVPAEDISAAEAELEALEKGLQTCWRNRQRAKRSLVDLASRAMALGVEVPAKAASIAQAVAFEEAKRLGARAPELKKRR